MLSARAHAAASAVKAAWPDTNVVLGRSDDKSVALSIGAANLVVFSATVRVDRPRIATAS